MFVGGSYASLTYFGTRPSDCAQIWHACADRYSHLKTNLTHLTPGGFRGLNCLARLALARDRTPIIYISIALNRGQLNVGTKGLM